MKSKGQKIYKRKQPNILVPESDAQACCGISDRHGWYAHDPRSELKQLQAIAGQSLNISTGTQNPN